MHNAHRVTAEDERQRAFVVVVVQEEIPPEVGLERRELVLRVPKICIHTHTHTHTHTHKHT